jgi:hypothetical protein
MTSGVVWVQTYAPVTEIILEHDWAVEGAAGSVLFSGIDETNGNIMLVGGKDIVSVSDFPRIEVAIDGVPDQNTNYYYRQYAQEGTGRSEGYNQGLVNVPAATTSPNHFAIIGGMPSLVYTQLIHGQDFSLSNNKATTSGHRNAIQTENGLKALMASDSNFTAGKTFAIGYKM